MDTGAAAFTYPTPPTTPEKPTIRGPSSPSSAPPPPPPPPLGKPFTIRPSPTGGLGAFATRHLPPGTPLLDETPLLLCRRADIFLAFSRLRRRRQRKVLTLHANPHVKPGTPWLEAVWDTNSFATGAEGREAGLFRIAARFNHACAPGDNVHYAYDGERGRLRLWVKEEGGGVEEGEELKVCYGRGKTPALLYRWYGFRCNCGVCEGVSDEDMKQFSPKW